eukprot:Blabericola_migrator_1__7415@NODE_377_length_9219_cov_163_315122_g301_i0_p6_GENE_NODE_377_length_9219_cov_163_315122_g301_i0NODE_377_length_9219_cov_163_315122_g301_i0_p6_ORF_typecomplete_len147_score32_60AHSA1/PF08327_11/1_4e11_NODE_377_length_9219_cov_163_315122_g301_i014061846
MATTSAQESLIFNVPPRVIYESLATEEGLKRLALGKETKFPAEVGTHFSLLEGEFTGKILALEKDKLIQLSFKRQSWPKASQVTITLSPYQGRDDRTLLELKQTNIPVNPTVTEFATKAEVSALWERQFWNILDKVFGYGRDKIED